MNQSVGQALARRVANHVRTREVFLDERMDEYVILHGPSLG
jgi:hypothetical protein